jgi:hypothetical protein
MIENKELVFSLPSRWADSFEDIFFKMFLDARRTRLIDPIHIREMLTQRDSYYCQCWSLTQESQFFWMEYGYDGEAIRIEIDLADAFAMGFRIEPVIYTPFLPKEKWIKTQEEMGARFAKGDEMDIFQVDEDGYYEGDISAKTGEMCYADHVILTMYSIHDSDFYFEKIPLPKIIATKQPRYMIENEVRLFIKAYTYGNDIKDDEYYLKHNNYTMRVHSNYNDENADFDTHMPSLKPFSYAANNCFVKSILCHPNMPDKVFEQVHKCVEENKMLDIFKGRSTLFIGKL